MLPLHAPRPLRSSVKQGVTAVLLRGQQASGGLRYGLRQLSCPERGAVRGTEGRRRGLVPLWSLWVAAGLSWREGRPSIAWQYLAGRCSVELQGSCSCPRCGVDVCASAASHRQLSSGILRGAVRTAERWRWDLALRWSQCRLLALCRLLWRSTGFLREAVVHRWRPAVSLAQREGRGSCAPAILMASWMRCGEVDPVQGSVRCCASHSGPVLTSCPAGCVGGCVPHWEIVGGSVAACGMSPVS